MVAHTQSGEFAFMRDGGCDPRFFDFSEEYWADLDKLVQDSADPDYELRANLGVLPRLVMFQLYSDVINLDNLTTVAMSSWSDDEGVRSVLLRRRDVTGGVRKASEHILTGADIIHTRYSDGVVEQPEAAEEGIDDITRFLLSARTKKVVSIVRARRQKFIEAALISSQGAPHITIAPEDQRLFDQYRVSIGLLSVTSVA